MPIMTTWKSPGDPDELFRIATEKIAPVAQEVGRQNGRLATTIARTDDGLIYVNVWESEEGMRRAVEKVGPIAREHGLTQEDYQLYEVLLHVPA